MTLISGYFLLPHRFKWAAFVLIPVGLLFAITRFYYGIKPGWLNLKPFAVYSSYLDNKYFVFTGNNFGEEVPAIFIFTGLMLLVLSKEKNEAGGMNLIRLKSFILTFYVNFLLFIFATLFFFGFAYIQALIVCIFCIPLVYYCTFRINLYFSRGSL